MGIAGTTAADGESRPFEHLDAGMPFQQTAPDGRDLVCNQPKMAIVISLLDALELLPVTVITPDVRNRIAVSDFAQRLTLDKIDQVFRPF